MKRFLAVAFFLLLALCGVGWAQVTAPTATTFAVLDTTNQSNVQRVRVEPYFMSDNRAAGDDLEVAVVSSMAAVTADSAWSYTKGQKREWVVSMTTWTPSDSTFILTLKDYDYATDSLLNTYTQAVDYGKGTVFGSGGLAQCVTNFGGTPLGLNLSMAAYATVLKARNWTWHLYLWDVRMVHGTSDGAMAIYSQPDLNTGTILSADSGVAGTMVFTSALTGKYKYYSNFIDTDVHNGNSQALTGIVKQYKMNGGSWAGNISLYGDSVFVLLDSTAVDSGRTVTFVDSTTVYADSVRYGARYLSDWWTIIRSWLVGWRD